MNDKVSFANLDLGSAPPTYTKMDEIIVHLSAENLLGDYAKGFVREAWRVHPRRAEQVALTAAEVQEYAHYLLYQRVLYVRGECKDFRALKTLWIPSYLQHALSKVGEYVNRIKGFWFKPDCEPSTMTLDDARKVSNKIAAFENCLQVVRDAMPRGTDGDPEVMTTTLIANYVAAMDQLSHVSVSYLTAFLGLKVKQEIAMSSLYKVRYDDIEFIQCALTYEKGIY